MPRFFTRELLRWHEKNPRPLPWTGGPRDPYHIWISEVVMQQTRIEQGAPYYLAFIARFPSVYALARAPVDDVLHAWEGLGYYTRARNLHKAAIYIVEQLNGQFPASYDALLALPGIGPYSAAAIASFAYQLPYPVVDGNVKRLIARFEGITSSVSLPAVHEKIRLISADYLKGQDPADFNRAIMNFGALICKPKTPLCLSCVLAKKCYAFQHDLVNAIPVVDKKPIRTTRYFHFIVLHHQQKILLIRREEKDIWQGLYAPPLLEANSRKPSGKQINLLIHEVVGPVDIEFTSSSGVFQQPLSHQDIVGKFHHYEVMSSRKTIPKQGVWVTAKQWSTLAKPKMINDAFAVENDF